MDAQERLSTARSRSSLHPRTRGGIALTGECVGSAEAAGWNIGHHIPVHGRRAMGGLPRGNRQRYTREASYQRARHRLEDHCAWLDAGACMAAPFPPWLYRAGWIVKAACVAVIAGSDVTVCRRCAGYSTSLRRCGYRMRHGSLASLFHRRDEARGCRHTFRT
jgi:hypothetical protein